MVVESLIRPDWVAKNPFYSLFLGITLAFIGTSIGLFVFPDQAAFAGLLFVTIAAVPFLQKIVDFEEEKKGKIAESFWLRNRKIALIYGLFFLGVVITYLVWMLVLPKGVLPFFFDRQILTLSQPTVLGFFSQVQLSFFGVLINNLKILALILLLSFIYGMGSILVITWNASVLGVFIGSFGDYVSFIEFIPHTALEFTGFFFAAMAGGLLSMAFDENRAQYNSEKFWRAIQDCSALFILGVVLIIAGALVEMRLF